MRPTSEQIEEIKIIATTSPKEEMCGWIANGRVAIGQNLADFRKLDFELAFPDDATCIWHSHLEEPDFSDADIKASKWCGKPYFLFCVQNQATQYFDPNDIPPYLGREFHWAWQNCYVLMQDYYKQELKIELPDFYLSSPDSYLYESVGFVDQLPKNQFREIRDPSEVQQHDVFLSYEGTPFPNHISILVDPVQNTIIHHLVGQFSKPDRCRPLGRRGTTAWRHISLG